MDKKELYELFEHILKTRAALEPLERQYESLTAQAGEFQFKPQYESLDEYGKDDERIRAYRNRVNEAYDAKFEAQVAVNKAENKAVDVLNWGTWVRHGDVGIGLYFNDDDEGQWGVDVFPWGPDMPSLNRTPFAKAEE